MLDDRGHIAPDWLTELRIKGNDLSRAHDWPALQTHPAGAATR